MPERRPRAPFFFPIRAHCLPSVAVGRMCGSAWQVAGHGTSADSGHDSEFLLLLICYPVLYHAVRAAQAEASDGPFFNPPVLKQVHVWYLKTGF